MLPTLTTLIRHARQTSDPHPSALPFTTLRDLVDARATDSGLWLRYLHDGVQTDLRYDGFVHMVRRVSAALASTGLRPGERIATIAHNHWQTVVVYAAAWYAGLAVVPVNIGEDDDRIRYILTAAEVKWAFVLPEHRPRIEAMAPDLAIESELPESDLPVPSVSIDGESDALIVYTSGTTGHPKGVTLTHANLLEDARAIAIWQGIDVGTRMMCVLPIHHVNGTVVTLVTPFYVGASVVLCRKFHASSFFETVRDEGVHVVSVVPTLLQFLNHAHESEPSPETGLLRHIICGAGPLTVTVARTFEDRFGVRIIHGYGLSETTCYSCYLPVDLSAEDHRHWMRDHGYPSIGVAMPVNEMAIHDDQGRPLGDGERGEIVIRGRNVMKEYDRNPEANEKAFTYGWFRSGDEGFALSDPAGRRFYFITGRIKELIIRGGVNLAPLEIDEVINRAPGVKAGIAVGFENDWYGEEVGAYVQLADGAEPDPDAILAYCRGHLPFSKCPKVVVFGHQIPVTSTGKFQRMKVAHLFATWKHVQFRL
jgi:acyl-CoA synthetase (AMP-forming)/AMP-acid ligase II